ncbi:MAG: AraC family transcriptional regulator [Pseudomonadales bacterium]|nr:AraC family transcriptional regulator [Pseudomonadales bacterium]
MNAGFNGLSASQDGIVSSLEDRILKIAQIAGDYETDIPAITVHRRDDVSDPVPCIYDLGLAITIAGQKQVSVGTELYVNEPGQGLLASVDLPVSSGVTQASSSNPYLGIMLRLDSRLALQVAAGLSLPRPSRDPGFKGLTQGTLDSKLLEALDRLMALLDEPRLLSTVSPLIQQEILARLLLSPYGPQFIALNASGTPSRQVAQAMAWLKQHYMEPINIDRLAETSHMSPSTFRHHFKAVAGISPLQYLKQVRLQEARCLMLNHNLDAGAAGLRVGYESVSQFSREYARLFGQPPLRDINNLRTQITAEA